MDTSYHFSYLIEISLKIRRKAPSAEVADQVVCWSGGDTIYSGSEFLFLNVTIWVWWMQSGLQRSVVADIVKRVKYCCLILTWAAAVWWPTIFFFFYTIPIFENPNRLKKKKKKVVIFSIEPNWKLPFFLEYNGCIFTLSGGNLGLATQ